MFLSGIVGCSAKKERIKYDKHREKRMDENTVWVCRHLDGSESEMQ